MKSTMIPVFIFVINFQMKQNVSETESNWGFQKNVKTYSKQEILSDATFKAWPFSSDFNIACKDDQVNATTCKYYCPLVVNPTTTNYWKEFHLKCCRVFRSVFENGATHKN